MDDSRRTSISDALQAYQDVVLKQNLEALRFLIAEAETRPANPPAYCNTEEQIQTARIRLFSEHYGISNRDTKIGNIRDILGDDVLPEIVERCSLDGVDHGTVNTPQREAWFDAIHTAIAELNTLPHSDTQELDTAIAELSSKAHPLHLPPDFQYLATLVAGICGPGLPHYREMAQFSLLINTGEALENLKNEGVEGRVTVPVRNRPLDIYDFGALDTSWEDWDIAVGVRPGDGPRGGSGPWVVYCRPVGEEDSEWRWRYGVRDEIDYESELFDHVEDFLAWYAHFNEQKDENLEAVPLEQVM